MATDPKTRARNAFDDLPTPEKTAFVIEATFSTISAALRETGERLGSFITEFDPEDFFRSETEPEEEAPAPEEKPGTAKKPAATKRASTKRSGSKASPAKKSTAAKSTGKTAGRKKKSDDE